MKRNQKQYNTPDRKSKAEIRRIPIRELVSDQPYQREKFNPNTVRQIVNEGVDERRIGALMVSFRDGKYYVYDGQHRLAALMHEHPDGVYAVPCLVQELSYKEEALYFATQNDVKSPQTKYHNYVGLVEAEKVEAVEIKAVLDELGLRMGSHQANYTISCVAKINELYKRGNTDDLREKLMLIKKTWCGDSSSFSRKIIGGVSLFCDTYKGAFSDKQFIDALNKTLPKDIVRDGDSDLVAKGDVKYAKAIWQRYNRKRTNRLEYLFKG